MQNNKTVDYDFSFTPITHQAKILANQSKGWTQSLSFVIMLLLEQLVLY